MKGQFGLLHNNRKYHLIDDSRDGLNNSLCGIDAGIISPGWDLLIKDNGKCFEMPDEWKEETNFIPSEIVKNEYCHKCIAAASRIQGIPLSTIFIK